MILKAALPLFSPFSPVAEAPATSATKNRLRSPEPEARLRRAAARGGPVALGTPAAPYEPDGRSGRSPLAALDGFEELEIRVVTRSPEIVRELPLLVDLDRRSSVTVDLLVPAADAVLAWKMEPDGPSPRERLEAVSRLAAEGIAVRVLCLLVEGVNDGEAGLRRLLAAAREAGAWDVRALPAARSRFLPHLRPQTGAGDATFQRLRLEHGFPRQMTGRG